VAVGLTAILLWGLLQLFTSASKFSSTVAIESELCAAGRAVLTRISREVAGAAPLYLAYLKIDDNGEFDGLQFVAPVAGGGTRLAHVKYGPKDTSGSYRRLGRKVKEPTGDSDKLSQVVAISESDLELLGVNVERFNIRYIDAGTSVVTSGSKTFTSSDKMPQAILFEIRLRDPKGQASLTLSSAAYLPAAGF
jgi:hypothetical protein